MNQQTVDVKEYNQEVAGSSIQMRTHGNGDPLLILHGELGFPGWMKYHEKLSESYKVYAPSHPGFDTSPGIDWMMQVRDLAGWYLEAIEDIGLDNVNLLGLSFGGWLAAEMAVMDPGLFRKLVLVCPAGIKPEQGEIYDIFLNLAPDYLKESFHNPEGAEEYGLICPDEPTPEKLELWEVAREQSCKLAWKPYMYNPNLKHLLHRLKNLDTLVIWGREDRIVPLDSGRIYEDSVPGSILDVIDGCGHRPEIENPQLFSDKVLSFLD